MTQITFQAVPFHAGKHILVKIPQELHEKIDLNKKIRVILEIDDSRETEDVKMTKKSTMLETIHRWFLDRLKTDPNGMLMVTPRTITTTFNITRLEAEMYLTILVDEKKLDVVENEFGISYTPSKKKKGE